jgi:hypothetical protein
MTTELETRFRIPAARNARALPAITLEKQRVQGMPGAGRTRKPRGLNGKDAHKSSGKAETLRHSLRNGFTAYSALSPGYRAF